MHNQLEWLLRTSCYVFRILWGTDSLTLAMMEVFTPRNPANATNPHPHPIPREPVVQPLSAHHQTLPLTTDLQAMWCLPHCSPTCNPPWDVTDGLISKSCGDGQHSSWSFGTSHCKLVPSSLSSHNPGISWVSCNFKLSSWSVSSLLSLSVTIAHESELRLLHIFSLRQPIHCLVCTTVQGRSPPQVSCRLVSRQPASVFAWWAYWYRKLNLSKSKHPIFPQTI